MASKACHIQCSGKGSLPPPQRRSLRALPGLPARLSYPFPYLWREEQQTTAQESKSPEAFLSVLCALF